MAKERNIRVYGVQREDIDIDLMTQIVMQMGRQFAQETMTDGVTPLAPGDGPEGSDVDHEAAP